MTAQRRVLRNFVGGSYVDTVEGVTEDVVDPSTGEVFATMPVSGAADVDQAMGIAEEAFECWRETTPSERSLAMFRIADALEARADELVDLECQDTGKPRGLTRSEEIPPMVDQIRFFASACRLLEGRSAGEYMDGHTSFVRREPVGVCAQVTPWNYPDDDGGVEVRTRCRGRKHGGVEAGTHHAGEHARCSPRWLPSSCRRACSTCVCGNRRDRAVPW